MDSIDIAEFVLWFVFNSISAIAACVIAWTAWVRRSSDQRFSREKKAGQPHTEPRAEKNWIGILLAIHKQPSKRAAIDCIREEFGLGRIEVMDALRGLQDALFVFVDWDDDQVILLKRGRDYLQAEVLRHIQE